MVPYERKYVKTPGKALFGRKINKRCCIPDRSKTNHHQYAVTPVRINQRQKVRQSLKPTLQSRRRSSCLPLYALARSGLHRGIEGRKQGDVDLNDIPICILVQVNSGFIASSFAAVNCGSDDPSVPMDCLASD